MGLLARMRIFNGVVGNDEHLQNARCQINCHIVVHLSSSIIWVSFELINEHL